MYFDKHILSEIMQDYAKKRELHAMQLEQHKYAVYEKIPRIREIDTLLRSTAANVIKIALDKGIDPELAVNQLKEENLALQRERKELLIKNNISPNFLDDKPDCTICNDTGYIGTTPCRCLKYEYQQRLTKQLSSILPIKDQNFNTFRLDYYPNTIDARSNVAPREIMKYNYDICKNYADNFSLNSENLLFYGSSGLGKTFLSTCIAKTVTELGFSVAYDTTINLIRNYEIIKFNGANVIQAEQAVTRYEHADLLILDDLGTEHISAISIPTIYSIINLRLMSHKPMIISTNILPNDIENKYSSAIASRLLGDFKALRFIGEDIRKLKNKHKL